MLITLCCGGSGRPFCLASLYIVFFLRSSGRANFAMMHTIRTKSTSTRSPRVRQRRKKQVKIRNYNLHIMIAAAILADLGTRPVHLPCNTINQESVKVHHERAVSNRNDIQLSSNHYAICVEEPKRNAGQEGVGYKHKTMDSRVLRTDVPTLSSRYTRYSRKIQQSNYYECSKVYEKNYISPQKTVSIQNPSTHRQTSPKIQKMIMIIVPKKSRRKDSEWVQVRSDAVSFIIIFG